MNSFIENSFFSNLLLQLHVARYFTSDKKKDISVLQTIRFRKIKTVFAVRKNHIYAVFIETC